MAFCQEWITVEQIEKFALPMLKNGYKSIAYGYCGRVRWFMGATRLSQEDLATNAVSSLKVLIKRFKKKQ